ncbi:MULTISPECIES: hypothetical protein [Polymorphospora]|uniref:Uncharacterized protein n=1 Tax=Polymorphospora lycopeni TaxID=3140240 RepID=A0ABV5CY02_9ACTN
MVGEGSPRRRTPWLLVGLLALALGTAAFSVDRPLAGKAGLLLVLVGVNLVFWRVTTAVDRRTAGPGRRESTGVGGFADLPGRKSSSS